MFTICIYCYQAEKLCNISLAFFMFLFFFLFFTVDLLIVWLFAQIDIKISFSELPELNLH